MIENRIDKIEEQVRGASSIPAETKAELLKLLAALKTEIAALPEVHQETARTIAGFAHEATREELKPQRVEAAVQGLTDSVKGFEASYPNLTQIVNRIAFVLSNMGI